MSTIELELQEVKQLLYTVLQQQQQSAIFSKPILNTDEAAAFLGVSKRVLYKYTSKGILPFSKPNGKDVFFMRQDLVDWVADKRKPGQLDRRIAAASFVASKM